MENVYFDYQEERVKEIQDKGYEANPDEIVLFGHAILSEFNNEHYFPDVKIYNNAMYGATSRQLLYLHDYAVKLYKPKKLFLMVGTNDLNEKHGEHVAGHIHQGDVLDIAFNVNTLLSIFERNYHIEEIYIISPLPVGKNAVTNNRNNRSLWILGQEYKELALNFDGAVVKYINMHPEFLKDGELNPEYTTDGLHLNTMGYDKFASLLKPYIYE
ncbi:hypothetical protein A4S06_07160 [Erysipelotrichaceae bacterium MTC7]|nr:hypothetical protein A4S06_07160 [Erysipelotrichaceae bacterium MTC7]